MLILLPFGRVQLLEPCPVGSLPPGGVANFWPSGARIRTAQNFGAVLPKVERRSIRALNSAQFLGFVEKTAEFVASFNRNNPGK